MKTKLSALIFLVVAVVAKAQSNNLTALLQQGLFEEQATRNLDAAIEDYAALAKQFDKDRQLAATAVFRLGECYRAQGKTNEAAGQYQRVLRDFSDQPTLATLSRQNLVGMGAVKNEPSVGVVKTTEAEELERTQKILAQLQGFDLSQHRRMIPALVPDADFERLNEQLGLNEKYGDKPTETQILDRREELLKALKARAVKIINGLIQRADYLKNVVAEQQAAQKQNVVVSAVVENPDAVLLKKLEGKPIDELEKVLPTVLPDAALDELLKQRNEIQRDLATKLVDYGTNNVEVQRVEKMLAELNRQIGQKISGMMQGLKLRAELPVAAQKNRREELTVNVKSDEDKEIERIEKLIQTSPDLINAPSEGVNGNLTPLENAAAYGWLKVATFLLDHGANANAASDAALFSATRAGNRAMMELLLGRGANVNASNTDTLKHTPLHVAAGKGFQAVTQVLLAHKAEVNALTRDGMTPLMSAASANHVEIVKLLLAAAANANIQDGKGRTALNYAIKTSPEMVQALLAAGADPNTLDEFGRTPLSYAVERDSAATVKMLLDAKADPNAGKRDAPLLVAIHEKNVAVAELLLQAGAKPNSKSPVSFPVPNNSSGLTPLHFTVTQNQPALAQLLLKFKADPNDAQTDQRAVIFSALDKPEILKALLDAGAKTEVRDETATGNGMSSGNRLMMTPLLAAAGWQNQTNAVELLLAHGADANATDYRGNTPLYLAAAGLAEETIFEQLLAHGAKPNVRNAEGLTPLDLVKRGTTEPVWHFSQNAATPTSEQKAFAEKIIALLRAHGALDKLPDWDRIAVSRPAVNFYKMVFSRGTNDWNHFTLLELIYQVAGEQKLAFPDLTHVVIVRPSADGATVKRLPVNLLNATNGLEVASDLPLEFGDVVEIPEREHTLMESDNFTRRGMVGFSPILNDNDWSALLAHRKNRVGTVRLSVAGGKNAQLNLPVEYWPVIIPILGRDEAKAMLTSSSDLTRVKVTRQNLKTKKTDVWVLDCSHPKKAPDLWLRDGDVIEVPEKR